MKIITTTIALFALTACGDPIGENTSTLNELGIAEVTNVLSELAPRLDGKFTLGESPEEEYYLDLTSDQFESLKHDFPAALKELGRSKYGYDLFSDRGTVLNPKLSTFTFKMGMGTQFYYVVHGVRADLSETRPNTVVTIVETKKGEQ